MNRYIVATILIALAPTHSVANNTNFLPGDAFFFARLDIQSARKLSTSDSFILHYGRPSNSIFGCGYVGFEQIQITNITPEAKSAIVGAYSVFQAHAESWQLKRHMSVFVYDRKYDWQTFGISLQYNEKWVDDSVGFGAERDHVHLESFIDEAGAVTRNWRDSTKVGPLPADCPKRPGGEKYDSTKSKVKIDYNKCKLILLPNDDFESYLLPYDGLQLIEISNGNSIRYAYGNREWKRMD
jgi:hypothetical protein